MKICLINNLYQPFARGGAEVAVNAYAKLLEAAGHQIIIITTLPWGKARPASADKIFYLAGWSGVFYHLGKLPLLVRFVWQLGNIFNFISYFRVKKILAEERPALVMTHNLSGIGLLTPLAIRQLKIEHFHFLHDIQLLHPSGLMIYGQEKKVNSLFAKMYQAITEKLFGSPGKIISPSAWLLQEHVTRNFFSSSEKLVLPNPTLAVSTGVAAKNYPAFINARKFQFLYVGQLEEHKGVLLLTQTFTKINPDSADLVIIGGGSQFEALKQRYAMQKNISILGRKNREQVRAAMSQADCLVVPSLCYENAPSVIFEGLSSGLPIIASRLGGIPELLPDQLTFRPTDGADMLLKMNWAMEHPDELSRLTDISRNKQLISDKTIIMQNLII